MTPPWSAADFGLDPIAPMVGPFPHRNWLKTWWTHRGRGELHIAETANSLIALTTTETAVEFAGEADLTDYHSPLGSPQVPALTDFAAGLAAGVRFSLDSLPEAAATGVANALRAAGLQPTTTQHNVAAVLDLPDTFDDYLMSVVKKERHELRRKRRRFESEAGPGRLERRSGPQAVALFASLHRRSAGDKGTFMTDEMEQFFLGLHTDAGAVIDVLVDGSDRVVSAIFSFEDDAGFYLYNSAFEPEAQSLSPGNVMLSHLIERSIGEGRKVFDFLKGDETYKFRLGAIARPLYVVTATVGDTT
jgi:CelD/BcsL family acetyltransferase involved in cellulose biosynthesis